MYRNLLAGTIGCVLVITAVQAHQGGGVVLLDKKDKLAEEDPGYKLDPSALTDQVDKLVAKVVDGKPHKAYAVKLSKGDKLVIELKSKTFDAVVLVENAAKKVVALNDDAPGGGTGDTRFDSKLEWTVSASGEYRIIATCLEKKFGDFQLTVTKAK